MDAILDDVDHGVVFTSYRPSRSSAAADERKRSQEPPPLFTSAVGFALLLIVPFTLYATLIAADWAVAFAAAMLLAMAFAAHLAMGAQTIRNHDALIRNAHHALDAGDNILDALFAAARFYDPKNCTSTNCFQHVSFHSECLFARSAKIYGNPDWVHSYSFEQNIRLAIPVLFDLLFNSHKKGFMDGYVFAIPADPYGRDLETFANTVRRTLEVLSDYDPCKYRFMQKSYIDKVGWQIILCDHDIFLTTFAPFYKPNNARYMFPDCFEKEPCECPFLQSKEHDGTAKSNEFCYILLQPSVSFYYHDIGRDTPLTNWNEPKTIRDKIRLNFRLAGRGYEIPETVRYPMSHHIVKAHQMGDPVVEWWNTNSQSPI
eukprot:TRINITY_DN1323_c1_g1_i4.p1 TRINITY_DN1323_c1_g1~~TRINITY_DN1323_c1_g1_i4.p1  ORF type:complete len:373 (-),score=60.80 TRINITY_DN1323_c1_g1_i4:58-1176(-)